MQGRQDDEISMPTFVSGASRWTPPSLPHHSPLIMSQGHHITSRNPCPAIVKNLSLAVPTNQNSQTVYQRQGTMASSLPTTFDSKPPLQYLGGNFTGLRTARGTPLTSSQSPSTSPSSAAPASPNSTASSPSPL